MAKRPIVKCNFSWIFRVVVRLGEYDKGSETDGASPVDFDVAQKITHEGFNRTSFYNDVAIVKLVQKVKFTSKKKNE